MAQKKTVIERLRAAEQWMSSLPGHSGVPYGWLRELVHDAMQELQSESGELWMQTVTGRESHIRIFVAGKMGPRELDLLLEILRLHRSWMREEQQAIDVDGWHPTASDAEQTKETKTTP